MAALCQQLIDDLPARLSERPASLMPALQTLSMAGRVCPAALGAHVNALEAFVMGPLLLADLDAALLAARKTPIKADHRTGRTWGHSSEGIRMKAFALKVRQTAFHLLLKQDARSRISWSLSSEMAMPMCC